MGSTVIQRGRLGSLQEGGNEMVLGGSGEQHPPPGSAPSAPREHSLGLRALPATHTGAISN